jgi:hypothetical protein
MAKTAPLGSYMYAPTQPPKSIQDPRTPKWDAWERQRQADIAANDALFATSGQRGYVQSGGPVTFAPIPPDMAMPAPTNVVRGQPMMNPPAPQYLPQFANSTMAGGDQQYTPQMGKTASDYLVGLSRKTERGKDYAKIADSVRAMIKELGTTKDFSKRRAIVETLKRTGFIGGDQ